MARTKKPIDYENEIMRIEMQITRWENTIKELEEEKENLLLQQEQEELTRLYNIYKSSGLTFDSIIELISNSKTTNNNSISA